MNNIIKYLVESVQQHFEIVFETHLTNDEILALVKIAETYEVLASAYPPYTTLSAEAEVFEKFLMSKRISKTEYQSLVFEKFNIK